MFIPNFKTELKRTLKFKQGLSEAEHNETLQSLITGKELTQWGMSNAVTLMSQKVKSYDRASDLESLGGKIAMMDDSAWDSLMIKTAI